MSDAKIRIQQVGKTFVSEKREVEALKAGIKERDDRLAAAPSGQREHRDVARAKSGLRAQQPANVADERDVVIGARREHAEDRRRSAPCELRQFER